MGDEVYQPQDDEEVPADVGPLEPGDTLVDRGAEPMEEGYSPPEKPLAVDQPGTTAAEQREGEPLDRRLAREVPEEPRPGADGIGDMAGAEGEPRDEEVGDRDAGRLVSPDEGAHAGTDAELLAFDVGVDGGARTAEEAAVHIVPETPENPGNPGNDEEDAHP